MGMVSEVGGSLVGLTPSPLASTLAPTKVRIELTVRALFREVLAVEKAFDKHTFNLLNKPIR